MVFSVSEESITWATKNLEHRQCIAASWGVTKVLDPQPPVTQGGIEALFYGCDMAGMLKWLLPVLLFGNIGAAIPTYVRNDNSDAAYRVDSVNSATGEKRINGLIGRNREARKERMVGLYVYPGEYKYFRRHD